MIPRSFERRLLPLLPELVRRVGTPFYLYDGHGITDTHRELAAAFADHPFTQYFAVKALPNPNVLALLTAHGSGLDCASPAELELAERVGARGDAVVFTSNNTTGAEYVAALRAGALITFDDPALLARVPELPDVVAFRVAPNGIGGDHRLMGAAERTKFGVPVNELADAYRAAMARGARRFGIHGMMFANELDAGRAAAAVRGMLQVAADLAADLNIRFEYVNIGGGLGIPYHPEEQPFALRQFAAAVIADTRRLFGAHPPRLIMECGRYITGPHGVLVTSVVDRYRKAVPTVGLDISMSALMRPALYGAYHHISLPFAADRPEYAVDVVGSLCENMDKFAVGRPLPDPRPGDLALIHDVGAHGHSMGFCYNGRLRPAELLLTPDGAVVEIRRAEEFDDYTATVRWAPVPIAVRDTMENSEVRV